MDLIVQGIIGGIVAACAYYVGYRTARTDQRQRNSARSRKSAATRSRNRLSAKDRAELGL
jgi:hypothetical protein